MHMPFFHLSYRSFMTKFLQHDFNMQEVITVTQTTSKIIGWQRNQNKNKKNIYKGNSSSCLII